MRSDLKTPARGIDVLKKKAAASPAPQRNPTNAPEAGGTQSGKAMRPDDRRMRIAQLAYLKAERRCFQSNPEQDWLEAEAEIDGLPVNSGSSEERSATPGQ
jgi:hypothetical protein